MKLIFPSKTWLGRLNAFLVFFGVCSTVMAKVQEPEQEAMDRLSLLEVDWVRDESQAIAKIKELLKSLDRESMPFAWAHVYVFLKSKDELDKPPVTTKELRDDPFLKQDQSLQLRLIMHEIDEKIQDGKPAQQIAKLYQEGEAFCREAENALWCGRFYNHWVGYLYKINDTTAAFQRVKQAMDLLQGLPASHRYYYTLARNNLHTLFYRERQMKRAIETVEANFKEQYQSGFLEDAATECYNLVTYLLIDSPGDIQRIQKVLDQGLAIARESKKEFYVAALQAKQGRFFLEQKRYDAAVFQYNQAMEVFRKQDERLMYVRSAGELAAVLIKLNQWDKVQPLLLDAKSMIGIEYKAEHLELSELLYQVKKKKGDFASALKYFEEHYQISEEVAKLDKQAELTKYASEMGLKYEEEKNRRLESDNQIQKRELEKAEWIKMIAIVIGCLLLIMIALGAFALKQLRKTRIANNKKNMILSNIAQGICTIERDMTIGRDYTWHINRIFKSGLKTDGHDAIAQIFGHSQLNQEQCDVIREVIRSTIGEGELAWELNAGNLPHEVTYIMEESKQVLALDWAPIIEKSGHITRVLLTVQDITFRRQLEQEIDSQKQKSSQLLGIFEELSNADVHHAARLIEDLEKQILKLSGGKVQGDAQRSLLRSLHTCKGEARSIGLQSLSQQIHALESSLQQSVQGPLPLQKLDELLHEYRRFLRGAGDGLKATAPKSLLGIMDGILPGAIAHGTENDVHLRKIIVEDEVLIWSPEIANASRQVLTHALNNSFDHGFIFPRRRGKLLADPCISIAAHEKQGFIHVTLEDNGGGLDLEKLQDMAQRKGFNPERDQTIADVVFEDGVSTAEAVSISSGRGVGMSAIKQICEELGGRARITPAQATTGTRVTCSFSLAAGQKHQTAG